MKKLYEVGKFTKGDELLNYYTYQGDKKINGVARHTLLLQEPGVKALETEYDEISKNYQIQISVDKLKGYISETEIFYSKIMDKIYLDKNDYYEEVYDE